MVHINHRIGNFFFSILARIVINGTMRSAIWEYLRGTFAFTQQCPPASLSTLYCSLHFTPAALIGSLHFHCLKQALSSFFFHTAVVVIRKGNQACPASWRHSCSSQSWSASPEPSVSFCFHHFFKWQHFILTCLSFSSGWQERSLTNKPCSLLSSLQSLHQRNVFAEGPGGWGACRLK